ncbi:MAG: hypothetical protein IPM54_31825 [Polyangiaceae bacterium]|nr:hypothetical protein [Polyangiaceae bacterium]
MKHVRWGIIGSLAAGLVAIPAFADDQAQQQQGQAQPQAPQPIQEEPLRGDVDTTEIALAQTPPAVRQAIEKWAQGATIKEVHEVRQGSRIQYMAEIEREGKNLEVLVSQQGQVLLAGEDVGVDEDWF